MHLLQIVVFAAMATAAAITDPALAATDHKKNPCKDRTKGTCHYSNHGNTDIAMGKQMNYGTTVPKLLIEKFRDKCNPAGCPKDFHVKSEFVPKDNAKHAPHQGTNKQHGKITIKTTTAVWGKDQKDNVFGVLSRAVVTQAKTISRHPIFCSLACGKEPAVDQHLGPSEFTIKQLDKHGNIAAQIQATVAAEIDTGDSGDICSEIMTGAGAIAGALFGPAGGAVSGIFSLLSLICL